MSAVKPFSLSPSPTSLYLTANFKTAIHKTKFVIDGRQGLTCILGDVGMGKSSLLRFLFADYDARDDVRTAFIPQPSYKSDYAFTKAVAAQFGIPGKRSLYDQSRLLEEFLFAEFSAGRNVVLFIDEAQRLDDAMLEQVRGFLNFETPDDKLVQVVLAGQIELKARLQSRQNRALRSRVFAPTVLSPFSLQEAEAMIIHRCELTGIPVPFPPVTMEEMYKITAGIPREILKLAGLTYDAMRLAGLREVAPELLAALIGEFRLEEESDEQETPANQGAEAAV